MRRESPILKLRVETWVVVKLFFQQGPYKPVIYSEGFCDPLFVFEDFTEDYRFVTYGGREICLLGCVVCELGLPNWATARSALV